MNWKLSDEVWSPIAGCLAAVVIILGVSCWFERTARIEAEAQVVRVDSEARFWHNRWIQHIENCPQPDSQRFIFTADTVEIDSNEIIDSIRYWRNPND